MDDEEVLFPAELAAANRLEYDYADGEGIEFYPFERFVPRAETEAWFRSWTGNTEADGSVFRVFGQDGTGGYAAIWLAKPSAALLNQPIVFMGSEGEAGVVATDFADYLCLVASGIGPYEAVANPDLPGMANPEAIELAGQYVGQLLPRSEVLARGAAEFPTFREWLDSQCR